MILSFSLWLRLGGCSGTGAEPLLASGSYCSNPSGIGQECPRSEKSKMRTTSTPAGFAAVSVLLTLVCRDVLALGVGFSNKPPRSTKTTPGQEG